MGSFWSRRLIGQSEGRLSIALVAVIAYNAVAVELVAGLGYFGQLVVQQQTGVNLPWELYAAFGVAAAAALGYRTIDIGARLLAVLMIAEIGRASCRERVSLTV